MHAINAPGMYQYWKSKFWEFRPKKNFLSYIEQHFASFFYIGSVSDFHDMLLVLIVDNYICTLDDGGDGAAE